MSTFHAEEGWFFERVGNGDVLVTKRKDAGLESPIVSQIIFTPETWASIVASVSAKGESGGRWQQALDFHIRKIGINDGTIDDSITRDSINKTGR